MSNHDEDIAELIHSIFVRLRGRVSSGSGLFFGSDHTSHERERILLTLRKDSTAQKNLARLSMVSPQSMSESLAKLEHDGYITRSRNENDRRETIVSITDKGREHAAELEAMRIRRIEEFLMPLDETEREALYTILIKLIKANLND